MRHDWLPAALPSLTGACVAAAACLAFAGRPALAATPPAVQPRIMTQVGLDLALTLELLQNEALMIEYNDQKPPKCSKLVTAGSIKTLSVTPVSSTQRTSKIDIYFDAACTRPYVEATVTVKVSTGTEVATIGETANYFQSNGKPLGALAVSDVLSITNSIETLRGLGKFSPVGQPVASLGFTCSIPTTNNSKTATCQGGVAQTFRSLNLSLANVVPFTLTAANNTGVSSAKMTSTTANLRTGPAGSLSITAPTPQTLGIGGGGTAYGTTTMSGAEARFTLFPPEPTQWTFTDSAHAAKFSFHIASNTTRAARANVQATAPVKPLAAITMDESGLGKVTYSDGRSAPIRNWLPSD